MKKTNLVSLALSFLIVPIGVYAEDSHYNTDVEAGVIVSGGRKDSSKAEEYRDSSSGPTGSVELNYSDESKDYHANARGENIERKDARAEVSSGQYGKYNFEMSYDQIPHRTSYGSSSIYSGDGSANLTLPDSVQSTAGASKSDSELVGNVEAFDRHNIDVEPIS